jgi:hypothetical protein
MRTPIGAIDGMFAYPVPVELSFACTEGDVDAIATRSVVRMEMRWQNVYPCPSSVEDLMMILRC